MPTTTPQEPATSAGTLRGTGFGRLWVSSGGANLGDGVLLGGLPVLATTVTDSAIAIAGVTVSLLLPRVLTALPAGALADRGDRRRVLVLGNAGRAGSLLVLLGLTALLDLRLALLYAFGAVASSSEVLVDTTAQAAVPGLVPGTRLDGANARLMATQVVGSDAVGAPVGAALAGLGAPALLAPAAAFYGVATAAAARLRPVRRAGAPPGDGTSGTRVARRIRAEVTEGLTHLRRDAVLRRLAVANALANLGNTAFAAILVVFLVGPLGRSPTTYGGMLAAVAVGGLAGGVVAENVLRRVASVHAIRACFAVAAVSYGAVALAREVVVVAVLAAVLGAASMLINVAARTLRQRRVPDALLGRVTASMAAVALAATPLGAALGGVVAEWTGAATVAWLASAMNLLALLLLARSST